jgi:hypothetical protein
MKRLTLIIAWLCLTAAAAWAEDAPHQVRKIAPERFQPNPRADSGGSSKPAKVIAPTKERPFGGCEKSTRDWIFCLRSTADLADALVREAEEAAAKVVLNRPGLNAVTGQGFAKDLKEAGVKWLALREIECGKMALQEETDVGTAYEARMLCQIQRDRERADQLLARFGATAATMSNEPQ